MPEALQRAQVPFGALCRVLLPDEVVGVAKMAPKQIYAAFLGHDLSTYAGARVAYLAIKRGSTREAPVFEMSWTCVIFRDVKPVAPVKMAMHKAQTNLKEKRRPVPEMEPIAENTRFNIE